RRGDLAGTTTLQLTRDGDGRGAHLVRVPARLEQDVDMKTAVAGRLRVADDPALVEQQTQLSRCRPHLVEVDSRLRVEVETQLVGDLGTVMHVRPQMEAEAREVDRPHDVRDVRED